MNNNRYSYNAQQQAALQNAKQQSMTSINSNSAAQPGIAYGGGVNSGMGYTTSLNHNNCNFDRFSNLPRLPQTTNTNTPQQWTNINQLQHAVHTANSVPLQGNTSSSLSNSLHTNWSSNTGNMTNLNQNHIPYSGALTTMSTTASSMQSNIGLNNLNNIVSSTPNRIGRPPIKNITNTRPLTGAPLRQTSQSSLHGQVQGSGTIQTSCNQQQQNNTLPNISATLTKTHSEKTNNTCLQQNLNNNLPNISTTPIQKHTQSLNKSRNQENLNNIVTNTVATLAQTHSDSGNQKNLNNTAANISPTLEEKQAATNTSSVQPQKLNNNAIKMPTSHANTRANTDKIQSTQPKQETSQNTTNNDIDMDYNTEIDANENISVSHQQQIPPLTDDHGEQVTQPMIVTDVVLDTPFTVQPLNSPSTIAIKNEINHQPNDVAGKIANTIHSFNDKLLNIHFGSSDESIIAAAMNKDIAQLTNIKNKIIDQSNGDISMSEWCHWFVSRYYCSSLLNTNHLLAAQGLANKQISVKQCILKRQIWQKTIQCVADEFIWFTNQYFNQFQQQFKDDLIKICSNKKVSNESLIQIKSRMRQNIVYRLNPHLDKPENANTNRRRVWLTVWPVKVNMLFKKTVGTVLEKMTNQLPDDWQIAIENNSWYTLLEQLFQLNDPNCKRLCKSFWMSVYCKAAYAMLKLISIIITFISKMRAYQKSNKVMWFVDPVWTSAKFVLALWPSILRKYCKPHLLVDSNFIYDIDGIGLRLLRLAHFAVFGMHHPNKFLNKISFYESIAPISKYGFKSQLDKFAYIPTLEFDEINAYQWNVANINSHVTNQYTYLCSMYFQGLVTQCPTIVRKLYGCAKFTNNGDFCSKYINAKTYKGSICKIMDCFDEKCVDILSDAQESSAKQVFLNIYQTKMNLKQNPQTCILTTWTQYYQSPPTSM